jgi:hypothetical protein
MQWRMGWGVRRSADLALVYSPQRGVVPETNLRRGGSAHSQNKEKTYMTKTIQSKANVRKNNPEQTNHKYFYPESRIFRGLPLARQHRCLVRRASGGLSQPSARPGRSGSAGLNSSQPRPWAELQGDRAVVVGGKKSEKKRRRRRGC